MLLGPYTWQIVIGTSLALTLYFMVGDPPWWFMWLLILGFGVIAVMMMAGNSPISPVT